MIKIPWQSKEIFSGLEIEQGYVKFVQAEASFNIRKIVRLIVKRLPSQSEKEIIASLKSFANEVKGQIGHLTAIIPCHKLTVRFLRFPSVDEKEITGMVQLQSAKELPFPKEKIISDYLITEQTKDGYTKIALVIVHQDVVNGYLDILSQAGLHPERVTFSVEVSLNWFRAVFSREKLQGSSILIDLDSDNIDVIIFKNYNLDFTRGLNFGIAQLQNNPDLKKRLRQELERTIEGYLRQGGQERAQRLLLTQAGAVSEQLKPYLEQEFKLPTEIVFPLKNLTYQKGIPSLEYRDELSLLRVLGAVLNRQGKELNLLPADLRENRKLKIRAKKMREVLALVGCIILLSTAIFAKKVYNKQTRLAYLNKEIKSVAQVSRKAENMLRAVELIEGRRKIEGSVVDALRELHLLTPLSISFSSFDYDEEQRTAVFQGGSENMSEIINFTSIMEKSSFFKNVQLKYVSEKKVKTAGFIDFKIECNLEK